MLRLRRRDRWSRSIGNGTRCTFVVTHPLRSKTVLPQIISNITGKIVLADVTIVDRSTIVVSFAQPPLPDEYQIVLRR